MADDVAEANEDWYKGSQTKLNKALIRGLLSEVNSLVEGGFPITLTGRGCYEGYSALHAAAVASSYDPSAKAFEGNPASFKRNPGINLVLSHGFPLANLDLVPKGDLMCGRTPLCWAATHHKGSACIDLLLLGANPYIRDHYGRNFVDYARPGKLVNVWTHFCTYVPDVGVETFAVVSRLDVADSGGGTAADPLGKACWIVAQLPQELQVHVLTHISGDWHGCVPTGLSEEARQAYAAEHPSLPVADVDGNGPADPGTALFFRDSYVESAFLLDHLRAMAVAVVEAATAAVPTLRESLVSRHRIRYVLRMVAGQLFLACCEFAAVRAVWTASSERDDQGAVLGQLATSLATVSGLAEAGTLGRSDIDSRCTLLKSHLGIVAIMAAVEGLEAGQ